MCGNPHLWINSSVSSCPLFTAQSCRLVLSKVHPSLFPSNGNLMNYGEFMGIYKSVKESRCFKMYFMSLWRSSRCPPPVAPCTVSLFISYVLEFAHFWNVIGWTGLKTGACSHGLMLFLNHSIVIPYKTNAEHPLWLLYVLLQSAQQKTA